MANSLQILPFKRTLSSWNYDRILNTVAAWCLAIMWLLPLL